MADSSEEHRTCEATPRRVAQARSAGQIPLSRDLMSGVVMLAASVAVIAGGKAALGGLVLFFRETIQSSTAEVPVSAALVAGLREVGSVLGFPLLAMVIAALAIGVFQTRGLLSIKLLGPAPERISVRFGRLWGTASLAMAAKELLKFAVLLTAGVLCICSVASSIAGSTGSNGARIVDSVFASAKYVGVCLALTMLGLGFADYLWQVHRHRKTLRMTHHEARREHKETEGDPAIKSERNRILHSEILQANAVSQLAEANLVVTDPGKVAIALRYDPAASGAPVVVCTGRDYWATRIEELASRSGVPSIVDTALAGLLATTEEGGEIPENAYELVAALLVHCRRGSAERAELGSIV